SSRTSLMFDLIFAVTDIIAFVEMSNIGDITNEVDIVAIVFQDATQPICSDEGAQVANMDIFVDGGAAVIDANSGRTERLKEVFFSGQCIIQVNRFCCDDRHELGSPLS